MQSTIFHLIGKPGVGKFTIGSALAVATGARLVDNHSIANVIFNVLDQDGIKPLPEGVWSYVRMVRRAALDAIIDLSPAELSFVFTNYLAGESESEMAVFDEAVAVAEARGSLFVPVILSCETPELVRRIVSPARKERMKLIDPVQGARLNDEVPQFSTDHPNVICLDVTRMPPEESARIIIDWAASRRS